MGPEYLICMALIENKLTAYVAEAIRRTVNLSWVSGSKKFSGKVKKTTYREAMPRHRGGKQICRVYTRKLNTLTPLIMYLNHKYY